MTNYSDGPNSIRFSLISCKTEDSLDSNGLSTPLDASPLPPPSNTFSIINIVNDDPLPNMKRLPDIASTFAARRRAQTSPRPDLSSLTAQPISHPNLINNGVSNRYEINSNSNSSNKFKSPVPNSSRLTRFWPKFKQSLSFTSQTVANSHDKTEIFESKPSDNKSKSWFNKNRTRVGPQR